VIFWIGIILIVVALVIAFYNEVTSPMYDLFFGFISAFVGGTMPPKQTVWQRHKVSIALGVVGLGLAIWFF